MSVTIYHNPKCSKSRKTLELLQAADVDFTIVEYLREPPDADRILVLARVLGVPVADLLRPGDAAVKEASDLPDPDDDAALAAWLARNPSALERPVVIDDERGMAVVGRPPENVSTLIS